MMQLLLLLISLFWVVSSRGVNAFQSPTKRTCHHRRKISPLYARKHLLYTQQHAYERFLNGSALLNDKEFYSSPSLGDDDSSLQEQFHERVGRVNRGVKQAGFMVLWKASKPSILIGGSPFCRKYNKGRRRFIISVRK